MSGRLLDPLADACGVDEPPEPIAEVDQLVDRVDGGARDVVDATVGATDADEAVARVLQRSGRPVVLAANKVDDQRAEAEAYGLWNLGLGEPYPVSALHGRVSRHMWHHLYPDRPEEEVPIGHITNGVHVRTWIAADWRFGNR